MLTIALLCQALLAQNIRHQGLSVVYNALLSRSISNNVFSLEYPEAAGKMIYELKPAFSKAIVLGVVRMENDTPNLMLNVSPDFIVEEEDRLVLVAKNSKDTLFQSAAVSSQTKEMKASKQLAIEEQSETVNILLLGWNNHVPALIKELCSYEEESYHITMVFIHSKEERLAELEKIENLTDRITWDYIEEDYVKESALKKIKPSSYDMILLVSSDRISETEEADARTILGYVLLEAMLESATQNPLC